MATKTELIINPEFCEIISTYLNEEIPGSDYIPHEFQIPITELDGVEVCIELYKYKHGCLVGSFQTAKFGIKIDCSGIRENSGDEQNKRLWTKTDFKTIMEAMNYFVNEFLPNFKIDKLNGKIKTDPLNESRSKLLVEFSKLIEPFERVKTLYSKCCVCYDFTKSKTGCCKCALCLTCVSKLPFETNMDEGEVGYKCPHCRQVTDVLN